MSTGKLSEKFAKLTGSTGGNKNTVKVVQRAVVQKGKRDSAVNSKRGIQPKNNNNRNNNNNNNNRNSPNKGNQVKARRVTNGIKGKSRPGSASSNGSNRNNNNTKNKKNAGRGNNKRNNNKGRNNKKAKEETKQEDLDMDMDKYWFEAGKGPNPVVASLDREIEEYRQQAAKSSTEAPVAAAETVAE